MNDMVLLRSDLCSTLFGSCYNMEHQKRASVLYSASWETLYGNVAGSDTTPCLQLEIVAVERGRRSAFLRRCNLATSFASVARRSTSWTKSS